MDRTAAAEASNADAARTARRRATVRFVQLAAVLTLAVVVGPLIAEAAPGGTYVVASGSMAPHIPKGSLVWVAGGDAHAGDVIAYRSAAGAVQIHRIVDVRHTDDSTTYVTRGDANRATDSYVVGTNQVEGVVEATLPYAGWPWLLPHSLALVLVACVVLVYVGATLLEFRAGAAPARAGDRGARTMNRRRVLVALATVVLVILLNLPGAGAGIAAAYPSSAHLASVASTAPLPYQPGTMGTTSITEFGGAVTATAPSPVTRGEYVAWSCTAAAATCAVALPSGAYVVQSDSLFQVDTGRYRPAPTFYFEAFLQAPAGATAYAILYSKGQALDVAGSEVSTTSTSPVLVRSAGFALTGTREYQVRIKTDSGSPGGALYLAKVLTSQNLLDQAHTPRIQANLHLASASATTSTTAIEPSRAGRFVWEPSRFDAVQNAWFEVVASMTPGAAQPGRVHLYDLTAGTVVSTEIAIAKNEVVPSRTTRGNMDATLIAGHEYAVRYYVLSGGAAEIRLHAARLYAYQNGFTKTVHAIAFPGRADATDPAFAAALAPSGYFADERGAPYAEFEATLIGSAAATTSSARLATYPAAGAVTASAVQATGTTLERVRSAFFTLPTGELRLETAASSGTGTVRNAWVLVPQEAPKTYDAIVHQEVPAAGCTWTFHLVAGGSSNLSRLASATVSLAGDAPSTVQIAAAGGALTQSQGPDVTVSPGAALRHVVTTDPTTTGISSITATLYGACGGLHTTTPITYGFT